MPRRAGLVPDWRSFARGAPGAKRRLLAFHQGLSGETKELALTRPRARAAGPLGRSNWVVSEINTLKCVSSRTAAAADARGRDGRGAISQPAPVAMPPPTPRGRLMRIRPGERHGRSTGTWRAGCSKNIQVCRYSTNAGPHAPCPRTCHGEKKAELYRIVAAKSRLDPDMPTGGEHHEFMGQEHRFSHEVSRREFVPAKLHDCLKVTNDTFSI